MCLPAFILQLNVNRETESEEGTEREKRMHNAIIDLAGMEMRETETDAGEKCQQSRTLKSKALFTQD